MNKTNSAAVATLFTIVGATISVFLSAGFDNPTNIATAKPISVDAEKKLEELGIELPQPTQSLAIFKKAVVVDKMIYLSGHVSVDASGKIMKGKVGEDISVEEGAQAARRCAIALLGTLRNELSTLNKVKRLVKTTGMVNCSPDFTQQPEVINGCSQLFVDIFGEENGKGARAAVGMSSLPRGAVCEIEMICELK